MDTTRIANLITEARSLGMELEEDNYGQLILYTGVKLNDDNTVSEMSAEDYDE